MCLEPVQSIHGLIPVHQFLMDENHEKISEGQGKVDLPGQRGPSGQNLQVHGHNGLVKRRTSNKAPLKFILNT